MSEAGYYAAPRARRSLQHFLTGRAASALLGAVWLVWLARQLPPAEYGTFLALLALVEIFYLASGFGLSTLAQRYVAEFRLQAPARQFRAFLGRLLALRLAAALAGAAALAAVLGPLLAWWGVALAPGAGAWFVAWLAAGALMRYLDELLPALLLHGTSQALSVCANLLRLAFAAVVVQRGTALDHALLVQLEVALSLAVAVAALGRLGAHLRRHPGRTDGPPHANPSMWPVARRYYLLQLLDQAWSGNAAKLVLSRVAGAGATAAFGFGLALVDTLRRATPAYLLATWVRPLMVSRYLATRRMAPVGHMANAVFKLSLLAMLPFAAWFASHGDALAAWLSAGRYADGMGTLMAWLVLWLALQSLHLVVSMATATVEVATPNLWATALCCAALPLAVLVLPHAGLPGVAIMLCAAEAAWVAIVLGWLARTGHGLRLDLAGCARIAAVAAAVAGLLALGPPLQGPAVLLPGAVAILLVLGGCIVLKPLRAEERALMGEIVPARWIPW